ncbi:GumC family protein [Caballeronia sp. M23-90]
MVIATRARPDRKVAGVESTVRDYLNTTFYYRKVAVKVFFLVVAIATAVALLKPMPYRAEATLLVLLAGYYDQSNSVSGAAALQPAIGQLNGVEAQILSSPELHRDVVLARLGPNATPREIDSQLQEFERRLHIEQNDLANTINLSYSDGDPKAAAKALSGLLDQYFRRRATIFTSGRVSFLAGQRDEVASQLKKADAELAYFAKTHGIVNITDQISGALALENHLLQRQLENETKLAQDSGELKSLRASTKGVYPTIQMFTDDSEAARALGSMQLSLMQLEARRADFASRYLSDSPYVKQIDQQITDMRAIVAGQKQQLATTTRYGHNDYYDVVQGRLSTLNSSIAGEISQQQALQDQIDDARARLQALSDASGQIRQLQSNRDILSDSFRDRSRQVELATIQQGQVSQVNSTNVRIIQAPFPPSHRSVSAGMLIVASIPAGLLISALVVLMLASFRETFLSPEQAERSLLLPVLNAPVVTPSGAPNPSPSGTGGAINNTGDGFTHMACGRIIAAINASTDSFSKVVMVLSLGENDELSSVIQALALELEHRSSKSVLILDMASTSDTPLYGRADAFGLLTWPGKGHAASAVALPRRDTEQADGLLLERVDCHNIVIARPKDGCFPASWQQTILLFVELRKSHDYVLVHAPPASKSFTGIEHTQLADATLLAVRAEVTRKPAINGLKVQVQEAGGKLIGVVLTHRRTYIPSFIYRLV